MDIPILGHLSLSYDIKPGGYFSFANIIIRFYAFTYMPYDDHEKLKDQVGMLVGLFNSDDDGKVKLAKVQLIQLGKNTVPILKAVLDDMKRKQLEDQKKKNESDRHTKPERSVILYDLSVGRNEIEGDAEFSPSIVKGVLEVLSFFADDTLIQTFSEWLPLMEAIEALIKIGSESAFSTVVPALDNLFSWKYSDSARFSDKNRTASIENDIVTKIKAFVDKNVISEFITGYPNLDPGLKDIVSGLIVMDKSKNYSNQVLEWIDKGNEEDAMRLSNVVMSLEPKIDPKLSKRLFLKLISNNKGVESFLKYLLSNVEVNDMVEMELDLYLKSHQEHHQEGTVTWTITSNQYDNYPKPVAISKFIILRLREMREDAISYITKVLTDKNKDKVKAASWLLNRITEVAD